MRCIILWANQNSRQLLFGHRVLIIAETFASENFASDSPDYVSLLYGGEKISSWPQIEGEQETKAQVGWLQSVWPRSLFPLRMKIHHLHRED